MNEAASPPRVAAPVGTDAELYTLAERLYPLPRTLAGPAVLETLDIIGSWVPALRTREVPIGTQVFDWCVKPEWETRRPYHPSLADVPPYDGPLAYGEALIRGAESREVLLSTYTCHPRMANDNVSGMAVTAALGRWLSVFPRRYSYRLLFAPETIGALCWLNDVGVDGLSECIVAGYTINNCGDERSWSFVPSRKGDTLADRAARHVLRKWVGYLHPPYGNDHLYVGEHAIEYAFKDRGSDERQFCAPGVDLPIASVMRSKHGTYPEYHTPDDDLSVISPKGLGDTFRCYQRIIETIEANRTYRVTTIGEPCLSKYGLYPGDDGPNAQARIARDLCAYSDGEMDLIEIAEQTGRAVWEMARVAEKLERRGLLREVEPCR